jgi:hypothetical protein
VTDVVDYVLAAVDDFYAAAAAGDGPGGPGGTCRLLTVAGRHGSGRSSVLAAAAGRLAEEAAAAAGNGREGRFRVVYFRQQPRHAPRAVSRRPAAVTASPPLPPFPH